MAIASSKHFLLPVVPSSRLSLGCARACTRPTPFRSVCSVRRAGCGRRCVQAGHTDYAFFIYSQLPYLPSLKTLPPHVPLMT